MRLLPGVVVLTLALSLSTAPSAQLNGVKFGIPVLIETNDGGTRFPRVSMNSAGDAIAVWAQHPGTIWANRYIREIGWGTAEVVVMNDAISGYQQVAMDAEGNAIAVWEQGGVWANCYTAGVGWDSEPIRLSAHGGGGKPQIAMDATGNAIAVWSQTGGVWANTYLVSTGWGIAERIDISDVNTSSPQVAMNAAGNAFAVWGDSNMPSNIWANSYTLSTGWGAAELLEMEEDRFFDPDVAIDLSGNAIVVWMNFSERKIMANTYVSDTGWAGPEQVSETLGWDISEGPDSPRIAMNTEGNAVVVWGQFGGGISPANIWVNLYTFGTGWGIAEPLGEIFLGGYGPQVAMDEAGNAVAVWEQRESDNDHINIMASRFANEGNGDWSPPALVNREGPGSAFNPDVAMDAIGNAIVVFQQIDGSVWNIYASYYDVLNAPPIAVDDTASVIAGQAIEIPVLSNDTDADGDALTIIDVTTPLHGTVNAMGDVISYSSDVNFEGIDVFDYTISDGKATAIATVTVTVESPTPAVYYPSSEILYISEVQIGSSRQKTEVSGKACEVMLSRLQEPGYTFELLAYQKIAATNNPAAIYDPVAGTVEIPVVKIIGRNATYHTVLEKRSGTYIFDLKAATKN